MKDSVQKERQDHVFEFKLKVQVSSLKSSLKSLSLA